MVESGVMAAATDTPEWIVLTPSSDDAAWRQAIEQAATDAGRRYRQANDGAGDPGAGELWVTEDAAVVEAHGAKPIVVLMPRPDTSPEAVATALDTYPPHSVWHASRLLARAVDQDHRIIVSGATLSRLSPGPIELANGMKITPPRAGDVEPVRPAVRAALALFADGAPRPGVEAAWSERIFQYDPKASRNWDAAGQLDITGRPRILIYGPYLALPSGRWRTSIRFAVDQQAAKRAFRIDWGTQTAFVSAHVTPLEAGVYEVDLEHDWPEAALAEIRVVLLEGAFDGRFEFLGASVKFVDRPRLTEN